MRLAVYLLVAALLGALAGCSGTAGSSCTVINNQDGTATISCEDGTSTTVANGSDGQDGNSCTVTDNGNGTKTISCQDGTSATVSDGTDGADGSDGSDGQDGDSCTVADNGDGTSTITCEDGTTVVVADGDSCTVKDNGNGTKTITCEDGTSVTVTDGESGSDGGNVEITNFHGSDYLDGLDLEQSNKYRVNPTITAVTADAAGQVTVDFTVKTPDGKPVTTLSSVGANIAKLVPAGAGEASSHWVPYLYAAQTVSGSGYPMPEGTTAWQATRENTGTLTNLGNGAYRYVFATNVSSITVDGKAITYERNLTHRVAIMMGGHSGPTGDAIFDFVPDGSAVTESRNVVQTAACKSCHGEEFHGHGGDRVSVEVCATCHVPGNWDPQGGESLDLKEMIHKIHAGGELPSVAGPDGDPWATADNGSYAIWGYQNTKYEWWKVEFPAVLENCTKCHQGTGEQVSNWTTKPSRAACGACHDDIDFTQTVKTSPSYHPGGPQADDSTCATGACHGTTYAADLVHDWTKFNPDPRNVPEFTLDVKLSTPANGKYYEGSERPVVTVVIKRNGVALTNHDLEEGPAQGCAQTTGNCDADTDGKFANTSFFVHGPRAMRVPVLTYNARATILSSSADPFTVSAGSLILKVDQGQTVNDPLWGSTKGLSGNITVSMAAGTYTVSQLADKLNANSAFKARAIAYIDEATGRLGVRSRNMIAPFSVQLQSSTMATEVFGGDTTPHTVGRLYEFASATNGPSGGSTTINTLARRYVKNSSGVWVRRTDLDDPLVTRSADKIVYTLDPVADLQPGTYVVGLEISQLGRIDGTNYKTPSVIKVPFQVKTGTEELAVAGNCASCHEGPDGRGLIVDPSRHNKILDNTALDQCGSCHDYQAQYVPGQTTSSGPYVSGGSWSGARPISKRVHAVHYGSSLNYPLATVDYANGDPVAGRNWDITFPQDVRNCETCHPKGTSSGTWATRPSRLPCMGCHDSDEATAHIKTMTYDPTASEPWSGDEQEACATCH